MQSLSVSHIVNCFKSLKVSQQDYFSSNEILSLMTKLNGSPYDEDLHEQIWDECKYNSNGKAKLIDYAQFLVEADKILKSNQKQTTQKIAIIESKLKAYKNSATQSEYESKKKISQFQEELQQLNQRKIQLKTDIQLLAKPFGKVLSRIYNSSYSPYKQQQLPYMPVDKQQEYQQIKINKMQLLIYLGLFLLVISLPIVLITPNYMNIVLSMFVLSIYFFAYYNVKMLRVLCAITIITVFIDIIWMVLVMVPLWSPAVVSHHSHSMRFYQRAVIILYFVSWLAKIFLSVFLFFVSRDGEDKTYSVYLPIYEKNISSKDFTQSPTGIQFKTNTTQ